MLLNKERFISDTALHLYRTFIGALALYMDFPVSGSQMGWVSVKGSSSCKLSQTQTY